MRSIPLFLSLAATTLALSACSSINQATDAAEIGSEMDASALAAPGLQDGELAVPADYRSWPVFLADIDKADAMQIRDIYISPLGHQTQEGEDFPVGTVSVMEIWKPTMASDGTPEVDANGKMTKDELSLVFVMGKSEGAGELVEPDLRNGDWVYAGYQADGKTPGGPDASACRACHLTQADKDWVFHYDAYFAGRAE